MSEIDVSNAKNLKKIDLLRREQYYFHPKKTDVRIYFGARNYWYEQSRRYYINFVKGDDVIAANNFSNLIEAKKHLKSLAKAVSHATNNKYI